MILSNFIYLFIVFAGLLNCSVCGYLLHFFDLTLNNCVCFQDSTTETAFIARRRAAVASAGSKSLSDVKERAACAAPDLIDASESIQQEITFQQQKQFKNKIQGFLDGVLLQSEIPEDMQETAQAFLEAQDLADKKRDRTKLNQCEKLSRSTPQIQSVHKVWVQDEAWAEDFKRFIYTAEVSEALFFVVKDPATPPPTIHWTLVLQGGFVIDYTHLQYQAQGRPARVRNRGATFAYDPAVRTRRRVLVSPAFRERCPRISRVIDAACSHRLSQWTPLNSWEEFAARCEKGGKIPSLQSLWGQLPRQGLSTAAETFSAKLNFCNGCRRWLACTTSHEGPC